MYDRILDSLPASVRALTGAAMCAVGLEEWGDAVDYLNKALKRDPGNPGVHYYLGICKRETGKTKAWLLRKVDWNKSEDYFQWVIARDSAFQDVLYQFALLEECRKEYLSAIRAGHAQVEKRPDLASAPLGLFKLYRNYVANETDGALRWLQTQPSDYARYFVGEALRRSHWLALADSALRALLTQPSFSLVEAIYFSLARIAVEEERPAEAEQDFWKAVDAIRTPLGADLIFEEIKYIISDEELRLYSGLTSLDQKASFFKAFWTTRNPDPGLDVNSRIPEHYRRLIYAEEHYEYSGFRTQFTNPDRLHRLNFPRSFSLNHEFNDMGLIYIRQGAPGNVSRAQASEDRDPNESWYYDARGDVPKLIFHFIRSNSNGNNWRLAPLPNDPEHLSDIVSWDSRYAELTRNGAADQMRLSDQIVEQSQEAVRLALNTDEHTWKDETKPFDIPHSIERFRGKGRKALIDLSYAIPISTFASELGETTQTLRTVVGIAMHSLSTEAGFSRLDTISFPASKSSQGSYTGLFRYYMLPDLYTVTMSVRPLGTHFVGTWKSTIHVKEYPADNLSASDIELLIPSTEKTSLEIDGIKVAPSPFQVVPQDKPLYLYHHIYNLVKDADGKTRYRIQYVLTPATGALPAEQTLTDELVPGEEMRVLAQVQEDGTEDFVARFQKLDLSAIDPGRYRLSAIVTDRKRVKTISRSRLLDIAAP